MSRFLSFIEKNKSKPICFFTLNDTLSSEGIYDAVKKLKEGGFGGAYIHCRSGYTGGYLKDDWFDSCDIIISAMEEFGLEPWIYDEFGWPSGIAGGSVIRGSEELCQRWLVKNPRPEAPMGKVLAYYDEKGVLCDKEVAFFSMELIVNHSYVDVLSIEATQKFIEETYEKYRLRYGKRIKGFFTDEPQYGPDHAPWSAEIERRLEEKFKDYKSILPLLYSNDGGEEVRMFFNRAVADIFISNYIAPLSDWCEKHGYSFTGHILEEKELWLQIPSAGDVMGVYRAMQSPGIDWLGGEIGDMKTPKQASSVCQRYGKVKCVSECFALIGYGASFDKMKHVCDWQIAGGVSSICNIMGYSLKGRRKRDYPAGLAFVQPYYEKVGIYNEYLARLCAIPYAMREVADVLLIEPLHGAMRHCSYGRRFDAHGECLKKSEEYNRAIQHLTENNVLFHVASPSELTEATACGGRLKLGLYEYKTVISLDDDTDALLSALGVNYSKTPQNAQKRLFLGGASGEVYASAYERDGMRAIILKNLTEREITLTEVRLDGEEYSAEVDFYSMKLVKSSGVHLPANGLKVLTMDGQGEEIPSQMDFSGVQITNGGFNYYPADENLLVLDYCTYQTESESGRDFVIRLFERLVANAYSGALRMEFCFESRCRSEIPVGLMVETPSCFEVSFNGQAVEFSGNVAQVTVKEGVNKVLLKTNYTQNEQARKILNGEAGAEGDFNMLGSLFELENIYLRGNFGVFADDARINGGTVEASGFYIAERADRGGCNDAAVNGYPYYLGRMAYEKQVEVKPGERFLRMKNLCGAADVYWDGALFKTVLWNEGGILLPDGATGTHTLRIEHYNTVRNAIGPNHNFQNEPSMVGYTTFSGTPGWCDPQGRDMWTDKYRLALYGVEFEK